MIDTSKQYTYNSKPVRIYADGSDTYRNYIHLAYLDCEGWNHTICKESDLVEVWEPKEGELCFFWDDEQLLNHGSPHFGRYGTHSYSYEYYQHCAPFKGELPDAFKGLI